MDILKKIVLNGFFNTMFDESINKHARRLVLILTTACLMCGVIILTTLGLTSNDQVGVIIYWAMDAVLAIFILYIYIKLYVHIKKKKAEEKKNEEIRDRIRHEKEKAYESEYEHNNRYHT